MEQNKLIPIKLLREYFEALKGPGFKKSGMISKFCRITGVGNHIISKILHDPGYQPRFHNLRKVLIGILKCDKELPGAPQGAKIVRQVVMELAGNDKQLADMIVKLMEIGASGKTLDAKKVSMVDSAIDLLYSDIEEKPADDKSAK